MKGYCGSSPASPEFRPRNGQQCAFERQHRQERGHGQGLAAPARRVAAGHYSYGVDGDYFAAMGFSPRKDASHRGRCAPVIAGLCRGRGFRALYWPRASALGQRLFEGSEAAGDAQAFTVVGVVGAVKQAGLTDRTAQGAIYYPYALRTDDSLFIVVRTSLRPESLGPALEQLVRQIDPSCP